jgi:hypothetical protein
MHIGVRKRVPKRAEYGAALAMLASTSCSAGAREGGLFAGAVPVQSLPLRTGCLFGCGAKCQLSARRAPH